MSAPPLPAEVLVVDDDPEMRASCAQILEAAGYRVREADSGETGLARLCSHPPQLVLLDVAMPGMDGFETLKRIRSGPHPEVPVILLTGHRLDAASIGSGLELGAEEYLRKPVRPDELTARIRALLRLCAARLKLETFKRDQTAMLVHDLKQPLAVISLRAEFVADEATDPELKRSGQTIRDVCRQMEALVNSVLELSRVEAGHLKLSRARLDATRLAEGVVAQLRGLAARRGITLSFAASGSATLDADGAKILQVLQNLVGNALKFTPAGGRIDVTVTRIGGELQFAVEDSGCGVPPGDEARVFDRWQQTAAGRAKGGTGLGLAIARAIVEAHSGRIGVGPRAGGGRGARFWFVLPAAFDLAVG